MPGWLVTEFSITFPSWTNQSLVFWTKDQSERSIALTHLNVQAPDLHELAAVGAVVRDELRDHGHLLAGVHGKVAAGSEVGVVSLAPVVVVAAVLVADAVEPVVRGVVTALQTLAPVLAWAGSRGSPHSRPPHL